MLIIKKFSGDIPVIDYSITWYKRIGHGGAKKLLSSQNYLKGPVLEVYRAYRIAETTFEDSGDYIVQVQTQFDSDVKIVNLVIQEGILC